MELLNNLFAGFIIIVMSLLAYYSSVMVSEKKRRRRMGLTDYYDNIIKRENNGTNKEQKS